MTEAEFHSMSPIEVFRPRDWMSSQKMPGWKWLFLMENIQGMYSEQQYASIYEIAPLN